MLTLLHDSFNESHKWRCITTSATIHGRSSSCDVTCIRKHILLDCRPIQNPNPVLYAQHMQPMAIQRSSNFRILGFWIRRI